MVRIRFTGTQVSHANIDICLRPSKRRAENAGVDRAHKGKRRRTEDGGENAKPKVEGGGVVKPEVEGGDVMKHGDVKHLSHIAEISLCVY